MAHAKHGHGGGSHASHGSSHGSSHGASHGGDHGGGHGASHGAANGSGHGDSHGGGGSHGGSGGGGNIMMWILAFIVFCFISDATCTSFKKFVNGDNTNPPPQYEYRIINYSSNYGVTVHLSSEKMAAFLDASTPYCCINKANHYECGGEGEDISSKMGDSSSNTEFRFKSSNGKSGSLKIRIRDKTPNELSR